MVRCILLLPCLLLTPQNILAVVQEERLKEEDRVAAFVERGYVWPPAQLKPETEGWRKLFERRYQQIAAIENESEKYNAWLLAMGSSVAFPNFTETGWAMTRAPEELVSLLKMELRNGWAQADQENAHLCRSMGFRFTDESPPLFIPTNEINEHILTELQWMHEEWSGQELVPAAAYGLRVYQNNSELLMHVDNPNTHIISSIIHIDHSDDAKAWPLLLEDFQGNTNEITMTSGDMVFYESSKLFHGRPKKFDGSWYSSLFLHYYPKNWEVSGKNTQEYHFTIPPNWREHVALPDGVTPARMFGMGMEEWMCPDSWCNSINALKYKGPVKEGYLTLSTGERELVRREMTIDEL